MCRVVQHAADLVDDVEADEVAQRQRAHREADTGRHRSIEVLTGGETRLVGADRTREIGDEQRVRDEARTVADDDRLLAQADGEFADVLDELHVGQQRVDDLDERQHRRRVEEVHADDARRLLRRLRDLGDRQRRRVRREHTVVTNDVV